MIPIYLAAPVRPIDGETRTGNLRLARLYYRDLSLAFPDHAFLAPWILNVEVFEETEANVVQGMKRNCFWISGCAELWLAGPRVSDGMAYETGWARKIDKIVRRVIIWRRDHRDGPVSLIEAQNVDDEKDCLGQLYRDSAYQENP
jgi:hypothetical protein